MTLYSNPEEYGLTMVGEVDWNDEPYEFCLTVVWRDEAGNLYWGEDEGCSCPEPFENQNRDDLTQGSFFEIAEHLITSAKEHPNAADAAVELIGRLREKR
jgi:hypothetical protein